MELAPLAKQRFFDSNGTPLSGGKLYTYEAGSSTPKVTYSDRTGTANTNPIILDSAGYADIWIDSGYYKFILKDSSDNTIWTKDQLSLPSEAALASAFWRDVVYVTSADSPLTIVQGHNGKLLSVDASGGAVTVNLPQISLTELPFNVGFKLTDATNTLTINRTGTDTIEGSTSKTLNTRNASCQLIADVDKSPDQWAQLDFGVVDFSGYPTATPIAEDFIPMVDTSAGSLNKKASFKYFKNAVYRSVTTTDSVGVDDETMVLSGVSFTSTLPTAVGVAGKRYKYLHGGTSITNVYTLATTSAQTIGGIASGSYALYTNGEVVELESDGTNWIVVVHRTESPWTAYTPTLTGFGTTSGAAFNWRRIGDTMFVTGYFTTGTGTAVIASMTLPGTVAMNTTVLSKNNTSSNPGQILGEAAISSVQSVAKVVSAPATSTALVYFGGLIGAATTQTPQLGNTFSAGVLMSMNFQVPVSGWVA